MKNPLSIFLAVLLFCLSFGRCVTVNAANMNKIKTDFESYAVNEAVVSNENLSVTTGENCSVTVEAETGADGSVNQFARVRSAGGSQMVQLASAGESSRYARVRYRVRFTGMGKNEMSLYLNDGRASSMLVNGSGMHIYWGSDAPSKVYGASEKILSAIDANHWYDITVLVDGARACFQIYLDGRFIEERPFRKSTESMFQKLSLYYNKAAAAYFDVDDIEITTYDSPWLFAEDPVIAPLSAGDNELRLSFENFTRQPRTITPFVLIYRDGVLTKSFCDSLETKYGPDSVRTTEHTMHVSLTDEELAGNVTAKLFVWDGFATRRSILGEPIEIPCAK